MLVNLDPQSTAPIYQQISSSIRRVVADGELKAGQELPPARALAEALGVNVHTVLRAYALLRDEGLVQLRQGRSARIVKGAAADTALFHQALGAVVAHGRRLGIGQAEAASMLRRAFRT